MSFRKTQSWDNRVSGKLLPNGKTWTRRIIWLDGEDQQVKLKLEIDGEYREVFADETSARIIWKRFRAGESMDDSISIYGSPVSGPLKSKRGSE